MVYFRQADMPGRVWGIKKTRNQQRVCAMVVCWFRVRITINDGTSGFL